MKRSNKKQAKVETTVMNSFTQSMNDFDYNLVEQYQEDQIAEQQSLDEQVEEPSEVPAEPTIVETPESPIVEDSAENVAAKQLAASVINPPFQADVSLDVVKEIFSALKNRPTSVVVKTRILDGYLVIKVTITFKSKIIREYETFADKLLLSLIMKGMRGYCVNMDDYGNDPHILEYTEADPRIELFRLFMESPLKCRISTDYISRNDPDKKCFCADFTIAERMTVHFYLDHTEEIDNIINKAIA